MIQFRKKADMFSVAHAYFATLYMISMCRIIIYYLAHEDKIMFKPSVFNPSFYMRPLWSLANIDNDISFGSGS